jgi:hypothetical protein
VIFLSKLTLKLLFPNGFLPERPYRLWRIRETDCCLPSAVTLFSVGLDPLSVPGTGRLQKH